MNRWRLGALLLGGVCGTAPLSLPQQRPAAAQASVAWANDYNQAAAAAKKAGKPLLVAFRCER